MSGLLQAATLASAVCCGAVAGVFFAFSTFVMGGLRRLAPAQGLAAMQSINRAAVTPAFMALLFGTAVLCLGLVVGAGLSWSERGAPWSLAGGALYLAGSIGVTGAVNVPLNNALDAVDPADTRAALRWRRYATRWTAWNHVRALTCAAATALLAIALTRW
jgi:uncharacterized membrane protein